MGESENRAHNQMKHSQLIRELREMNSRIDGIYGILVTGDVVVTTNQCSVCQQATRDSITSLRSVVADMRNTMIGKAGFWSGIATITVMATLLGLVTAWAKLFG